MHSQIIYLHIPKTAGTSFRLLMIKNYPEDRLWWNVDDFSGNLNDYKFIGGHRPYDFYTEHKNPEKLFISVVREPVSRAISLFNYHVNGEDIQQRENMLKMGLVPDSMSATIDLCAHFRRQITNDQCRYLSGEGSFDAVLSVFKTESYVIGCLDEVDRFVEELALKFSWPNRELPRVYTGDHNYESEYFKDVELVKKIRDLNVEDQRLYEFVKEKAVYKGIKENPLFVDSTGNNWP